MAKEANDSPKKKKQTKQQEISYSNRGKSLEDDLNETNEFYLIRKLD